MKKIIIVLTAFMLLSLSSYAQKITYGLHAGANVSNFHPKDKFRVYDSENKVGIQVGGDLYCSIKNGITLSSGLDAIFLGGKFSTMSQYVNGGHNSTEFPEVNTKEIALEVPLKFGYKFALNDKLYIMPSVGVYCRYSILSIKDNVVSMANDETNTTVTEKWNCFKDYVNPKNQSMVIPAFNRWDFGLNAGVQAVAANHYSISASYSRGLKNHSEKYELKNEDFRFSLGYIF